MKRFHTCLFLMMLVFVAAFCTPVLAAAAGTVGDNTVTMEFPDTADVSQITSLQFQAKVEHAPKNAAVKIDFAASLQEENQVISRSTYRDGVLTVYLASSKALLGENEKTLLVGSIAADDDASAGAITLQLIPASLEFLNGADGTVDLPADGVRLISGLANTGDGETQNGVNKTDLNSMIAAYDKLRKADYTRESWAPFAKALEAAKAVAADENATQADVDAALTALSEAYGALCPAGDTETSKETTKDGIRKALKDLLKELDSLVSSDYTDESWNELYALMEQAREMLKNGDASEEELKELLVQLRETRNTLEEKDAETGGTADPNGEADGKGTNAPQTGDTSNPMIWIIIGSVGAAITIGAIILLIVKKKKS